MMQSHNSTNDHRIAVAQVGDRVPAATLRTRVGGQWLDVATTDLFADQTAIVFSLPGAFTPTCSGSQVPGYEALAASFAVEGVDAIYCLAVNDAFVMAAWARDLGVSQVQMLPDGNGEFTRAMGMAVGKADLGFGERSRRYSMLVRNGVIEQLFIEPDVPGDPYEVSDPETMLRALNPAAEIPSDVVVIGRADCSHCVRAKSMLQERGMPFDWVELTGALSNRTLVGLTGTATTPQVFVDGSLVGGADDLAHWLERSAA